MKRFIGLIIYVVVFTFSAFPQETAMIKLIDKVTGEPLPFAHLCFENKSVNRETFQISDISGTASEVINGKTVLAISMLGYKTFLDTLYNGGSFTYKLEPTVFDMDEVIVTAQIKPRKVDNSIYKVNMISNLDIREKAATNLSELLADKLNFRITQDAVLGSGITMNGLKGEHIKILIDGVPVIGRMNGNIDLSQLNMNNVDHIEIVEGPMSVQYGSNALAGAINIITRENMRNSLTAGLNSYYETVGVYNFDGSFTLNKKKHSLGMDAGRNFFGGYPKPSGIRTRLFKPKEQYFGNLYYLYSTGNTKIKADGSYFRETLLSNGAPVEVGVYYGQATDSYFYTDRLTGKLFFQQKLGNGSRLDIVNSIAGYSRIKNTWINDLVKLRKSISPLPELQDTSTFRDYMSRGTWSYAGKRERLSLQAGYDITVETGTGKRILDNKQVIGDYAAFTVLNFSLLRNLEFQGGLRYAYNTRYDSPLVPSLNIKYAPSGRLNLRASYVRGFRSPSLKELYLEFQDINHNILPSPDLRAEYSHNVNVSGNYRFDVSKSFFDVEMNGFYNKIDNSIQLALVDSATNQYGYVNVDGYSTSGGSVRFKYRLHPRFELSLGESATNHYYYFTGENGRVEDNAMSYEFTADMNYDLFRSDLFVSVFYKYTGKYPLLAGEGDDLHFGMVDAYNTMDITLNKSFMNRMFTVSTGVKNLFNVTSVYNGGGSAGVHSSGGDSNAISWGRSFFLKLSYNFAKY